MKTARIVFTVIVISWIGLGLTTSGQGMAETVGKIEITALRSLQIARATDLYYVRVVVEVRNGNPFGIRFRNADLQVRIKRYRDEITLGTAGTVDLVIPSNTTSDLVLMVEAGDKSPETLNRLFAVFNAVSDPNIVPTVLLDGTSDVGMQDPRGWLFEKEYEVDFEFRPEVKRRFLMK